MNEDASSAKPRPRRPPATEVSRADTLPPLVASPVDVVLFDLGGVPIEFGGVDPMNTETFLDAFRSWPREPMSGVDTFVRSVFRAVRVTGVDEARDALVNTGVVTAGD